jgi:hypothetical protein
MDVTLFELHLHDSEFNAPFAARRASGETDSAEDASATTGGAASKLGPLAALAALAGLALVVRYLRGAETEQSTLDGGTDRGDAEATDTEGESGETRGTTGDEDQRSLDEFDGAPRGVFGPGTMVLTGSAALLARTAGRLHRELEAASPGENGVVSPGPTRAAKGFAAYAVYVTLIAVNLGLLGVVPA